MTVRIEKPAINVREELADLRKPTGLAGEAMLRAETPQEQFNLIGAGRRNLIINGDFQVSQRGDYTSSTSVTSGNYYVDRWAITTSGVTANMIHSLATLPNGAKTKSIRVTATSSNTGYLELRQIVEDYLQISGQELMWSAWIRTNMASVGFRHNGHTDFGDKVYNDGQWHYITSRYTMDEPSSGSGANTAFSIISYNNAPVSISSGDYFEVAQVQLELGKVPTPFEHRSYGEELALCQRYYEEVPFGRITGYHTATVRAGFQWKVDKRAAPTVTFSSSVLSTGASTTLSTGNVTTYGMSVNASVGSPSSGIASQISIDAEL